MTVFVPIVIADWERNRRDKNKWSYVSYCSVLATHTIWAELPLWGRHTHKDIILAKHILYIVMFVFICCVSRGFNVRFGCHGEQRQELWLLNPFPIMFVETDTATRNESACHHRQRKLCMKSFFSPPFNSQRPWISWQCPCEDFGFESEVTVGR